MSSRISVLIFAIFLAQAWGSYEFIKYPKQLDKARFPESISSLESLKKFVQLVNDHNLNVSLIISNGKNYESGNLKRAMAMTITFPVNTESVTKATLEKEHFNKLAELANKEHVTVGGSIATNNKLKVITNNKKGLPITKAYKIFTGIKNGKTGFVFDEENYVAQYTFVTPGADGKNETTKVFYGDVNVEVVKKSETLSEDQLNIIKKAVIDALFSYESEYVPQAITAILAQKLPDKSWDAASVVGEHNAIDSNTYVMLQIMYENYLVYAS